VIRLHPDDLVAVQQNLATTRDLQEELAVARFVADPTVPRGGVRALDAAVVAALELAAGPAADDRSGVPA